MTVGQVRIVCTDRGTHASREIALLVHHGDDRELLDALQADPVLAGEPAEQVYRHDRLSYYQTRQARRGGSVHGGAVDAEVDDLDHATWRFRCPTCPRNVPAQADRLLRLVERLLDERVSTVDLTHLPEWLRAC